MDEFNRTHSDDQGYGEPSHTVPVHTYTSAPYNSTPSAPVTPTADEAPTAPVTDDVPAHAEPVKRHRRGVTAGIIAAITIILIGAGTAFALIPTLHKSTTKSASTAASTSSTTASQPASAVQTDDLSSGLQDASNSASQSQSDQQSSDNSINDSSSQVAVPTE